MRGSGLGLSGDIVMRPLPDGAAAVEPPDEPDDAHAEAYNVTPASDAVRSAAVRRRVVETDAISGTGVGEVFDSATVVRQRRTRCASLGTPSRNGDEHLLHAIDFSGLICVDVGGEAIDDVVVV